MELVLSVACNISLYLHGIIFSNLHTVFEHICPLTKSFTRLGLRHTHTKTYVIIQADFMVVGITQNTPLLLQVNR